MSQTPCWITLKSKHNAIEEPFWVPLRTFQRRFFSYTMSTLDVSGATRQKQIEPIVKRDTVYTGCDVTQTVNQCLVLFLNILHARALLPTTVRMDSELSLWRSQCRLTQAVVPHVDKVLVGRTF